MERDKEKWRKNLHHKQEKRGIGKVKERKVREVKQKKKERERERERER